ncbi:MAG: hypothetical protein NTZ64_15400 [Polaromonas sp.]|nr:hypothetical protein [Polaromonas sp.]
METKNKIQITSQLIAEWTHDATLLLNDCTEAEVRQDLKELGCPPKLLEQILQKAKTTVRARHRLLGLKVMLLGFCLIFIGCLLLYAGYFGVPIGDNKVMHIGAFFIFGPLIIFAGMTWVFGGLYKFFTGSTADVISRD